MSLALVPLRRLQPRQHLVRDGAPGLIHQESLIVQVQIHPLVRHSHNSAVHDHLPELFDQIENQAGLARPVDVDEPAIRVEPGQHQRPLDLAVENTIAIIERIVDRVTRASPPAPRPTVLLRDDLLERGPVLFRRPPLDGEQRPPRFVYRVPLEMPQFLQVIPHLVGAPAQLLVQFGVSLLAIL